MAAADDTANQAAIAIGAPRDPMSVETSADGLRIVAVKFRRGGNASNFDGVCKELYTLL